ncbi:MAG TPA: glucodextranase DOMON-like domain-containing protein [Thermoanaerobaculia bacterium]|nr:glucodextranase DOMON-like domain-containing protein [Thermoanaerobaculia bacterium]
MRKLHWRAAAVAAALGLAMAAAMPATAAQKVSFQDPKDDDNGPGKITYPTDPVYKPGSFDMTGFDLKVHGDSVDLAVELAAKLEDPWHTGSGFSVQMVFVFVRVEPTRKPLDRKARKAAAKEKEKEKEKAREKAGAGATKAGGEAAGAEKPAAEAGTAAPPGAEALAGEPAAADQATAGKPADAAGAAGTKAGAAGTKVGTTGTKAGAAAPAAKPKPHGFTQGLPGLNVRFAPEDGWDRCIILSPLPAARVKAEVEAKAPALKDAVVVPARVKGSGHTISATIDRKALGPPGDVTDWGYQVVIASSDPFPAAGSLLVRKVNETESQHRFGGGTDGDCGPNVLDVLADDGSGDPDEIAIQHTMLQYECNPDGTAKQLATLKMVHVDKDDDDDKDKEKDKDKKDQEQPKAGAAPPSGGQR